jgi:hypothetical protein
MTPSQFLKTKEKLIDAAAAFLWDYAQSNKHSGEEYSPRAVCLVALMIVANYRPSAVPSRNQDMIAEWNDKEWCDDLLLCIADSLEYARTVLPTTDDVGADHA